MKIRPMTMIMPKVSFAGKQIDTFQGQPVVELDDNTPDNAIVGVGSLDSSYRYPIFAHQVRKEREEQAKKAQEQTITTQPQVAKSTNTESYEEYYKRKINSPDWGAY